jgi:hypothetical protein
MAPALVLEIGSGHQLGPFRGDEVVAQDSFLDLIVRDLMQELVPSPSKVHQVES